MMIIKKMTKTKIDKDTWYYFEKIPPYGAKMLLFIVNKNNNSVFAKRNGIKLLISKHWTQIFEDE
jgi:hypothetical protein